MWFSSGNTKSVLHTDDYENILCVIDGVKNLKLVDPSAYPEESEVNLTILNPLVFLSVFY